jgi:excisionase family DNA binding protein
MHEQKVFSPKQASKILGVSTKTLQRWDNAGKIKTFRTKGNHRRIYENEILKLQGKSQEKNCAIYARVSSRKQAQDGNIERQKERLVEYAQDKGYVIKQVFCETASGINENRKQLKKLMRLVANHEVDIVLIEFKDRLARFGYTYLQELIESHGAKVEVVTQQEAACDAFHDAFHSKDATAELVEDMLAIVTCFSAKLYGQRSQQFKKKIVEAMRAMRSTTPSTKEVENVFGDKNHQDKDSKP